MNPLRKLIVDSKRYLSLLNRNGRYSFISLFFIVDYWVVVFFRLQELISLLPYLLRVPMKLFMSILTPVIEGVTGAKIRTGASIGAGLVVYNSFGVVIANGVQIGENCSIYSGVVIAHQVNDESAGVPKIGSDVVLMAGSKIFGRITIGDGAIIGANSVVIRDIPVNSVAIGIPAETKERL